MSATSEAIRFGLYAYLIAATLLLFDVTQPQIFNPFETAAIVGVVVCAMAFVLLADVEGER